MLIEKETTSSSSITHQREIRGTMNGLQSDWLQSVACLLLVTFDPGAAQKNKPCPTCDPGYYVTQNCSVSNQVKVGIMCRRCTDCSASHQETLVLCSTFTDSLCGNRSSPVVIVTQPEPPASAAGVWISLTVTACCLVLVLVLVLVLFLGMMSRWKHQPKPSYGPDQPWSRSTVVQINPDPHQP